MITRIQEVFAKRVRLDFIEEAEEITEDFHTLKTLLGDSHLFEVMQKASQEYEALTEKGDRESKEGLKALKMKYRNVSSIKDSHPIITTIKGFFASIFEFLKDPYNKLTKARVIETAEATEKEIAKKQDNNIQQSLNVGNSTAIIDKPEPTRAVKNITRRHSIPEVDDMNRAAVQHSKLLRSVSSPELTPANNKILTPLEESKHTWTELGTTADISLLNKAVIAQAAQFVSALVSPNASPAPDGPNPPASPPIPSTPPSPPPPIHVEMKDHVKLENAKTEMLSPSVKHSASVLETRVNTPADQYSDMVSTPPATSLKAEPVGPVSSSSVPPAPPPPPDLLPASKEVSNMHNQSFANALQGVSLKKGAQSSDLKKNLSTELEAKLAARRKGNIETGQIDKAPGGAAAQRYREDQQLFAQLAKEEEERQAQYKAIIVPHRFYRRVKIIN
ncbi:hypothetical protein [Candidatus Tisiphia endosymbiont of Nemotelus uliginosus]|uniref:hypothetical protein n=1 Tax=Candidatus Tisiphia endosymbiont of Nemotelus uliginosus TaxID=3077926 RepID=UPI0035C93612